MNFGTVLTRVIRERERERDRDTERDRDRESIGVTADELQDGADARDTRESIVADDLMLFSPPRHGRSVLFTTRLLIAEGTGPV